MLPKEDVENVHNADIEEAKRRDNTLCIFLRDRGCRVTEGLSIGAGNGGAVKLEVVCRCYIYIGRRKSRVSCSRVAERHPCIALGVEKGPEMRHLIPKIASVCVTREDHA